MKRKEAGQRGIADRVAAPQPVGDARADQRKGGEQAGDHRRPGEAHRAPGQHVAHERRRHHQEVDDHAENPQHLTRRLVGPVIEAAEDVDIDGQEEHRGAVGVQIADQPTIVDVAHDVLDRGERQRRAGYIVHRQHDPGDDLRHQHERQDRAESPEIVYVSRHRVDHERRMHQAHDRQARFKPPPEGALGDVGRGSAHGFDSLKMGFGRGCRKRSERLCNQPIFTFVSLRKVYSGTGRLSGAGPWRMRPDVS